MTSFQLDLAVVLLTLWPAFLILRRMGLSLVLLALLPFSLLLPLLGHMLFALTVCMRPWPKLPAAPKPVKREKLV